MRKQLIPIGSYVLFLGVFGHFDLILGMGFQETRQPPLAPGPPVSFTFDNYAPECVFPALAALSQSPVMPFFKPQWLFFSCTGVPFSMHRQLFCLAADMDITQ